MEQNELKNLVVAAQAGDPNSIEKLFEASYQDIYYFILKTVKETELAEDLTQDTFLRVIENLGELKAPEAFVTWSRQIAYRCCTDYFRKRKELLLDEYEEGQSPFDLIPEEDVEFIPHEALDREDLKNTLLKMLDTLPQEQRSAMVLRYYDELPVSQIAQVQNVSEGTVKSRLNYGRKALAQCVEDYEKKNGIKLHSVAFLPLLLWLFRKQKLAAGVSVSKTAMAVGAAAPAASSAVASGAAAVGAKAAAATGVKLALGAKIALVATIAVAVVAGAAVGIPASFKKDAPAKKSVRSTEPSSTIVAQPPEGEYTQNSLWLTEQTVMTYVKDQQIYYLSESGAVQLTSIGISEDAYEQLDVCFSNDMRYVCYTDGPLKMPEDDFGVPSYQYYYRDLENSAMDPIPLKGFMTMSGDGQRILLYESKGRDCKHILLDVPTGQKYVLYTGDIGVVAGVYLHDENLTTIVTIDYGPLDEPYENPLMHVWKDGESRLITSLCKSFKAPYIDNPQYFPPDWDMPDYFYYQESNGNLYRFDLNTLESNLCASNVFELLALDENNGALFRRYNPQFPEGHVDLSQYEINELLSGLIDFDSDVVLDWSEGSGANDRLSWERYDYFRYLDGVETCIAQNAARYWEDSGCFSYAYLQPEKVTPVKTSEYGKGALAEAKRRLLETAVLQVKSGVDTVEFHDPRYFENPRSKIEFSVNEMTVSCYVCTSFSREESKFTVYKATMTDGMFGSVTCEEITEKHISDIPRKPIKNTDSYEMQLEGDNYMLCKADGTCELYVDGNMVRTGTNNYIWLFNGLFWCTEFDSTTGLGVYCIVYDNGSVCEIARDVYIEHSIEVGDDWYLILADRAGADTGDLYLWQDEKLKLVESGIDNIRLPYSYIADPYSAWY